jgi:tripartite-type tricarboxylate transporter receptor subunit TctC
MRFCLLFAALWAASAGAQIYPNRPIRFVVPLAPAGAGDIVARTIAAKLAEAWGQQVVIDNRPGANTIIGTDLVAKSKPDGYTWLLGVQGSLAINPATYHSLPYDAEKDFDPVTQMTVYGYVLVVHPALPVKGVNELIALARSRPGQLAYGTSGNGGSNHLAGESFRLATDIKLNAIPYKGSAPALTALLSGDVPFMFDTLITSIPLVKAGRLRALGVTLPRRSSSMPDVATIAEAGVRGYEFTAGSPLSCRRHRQVDRQPDPVGRGEGSGAAGRQAQARRRRGQRTDWLNAGRVGAPDQDRYSALSRADRGFRNPHRMT